MSDSVEQHDFALLRRLALPNGTILRCEGYTLPTRDCLFEDPLHDGKTMLKIWNVIRFAGVVGAFICQGGGWSPETRRNKCFSEFSVSAMARASPADFEWKSYGVNVKGVSQFAVYLVEARKLQLLRPEDDVELTLEPLTYELLVVAPVRINSSERSVMFAPIRLAHMLNTAGAVQAFETRKDDARRKVTGRGGREGHGEPGDVLVGEARAVQVERRGRKRLSSRTRTAWSPSSCHGRGRPPSCVTSSTSSELAGPDAQRAPNNQSSV